MTKPNFFMLGAPKCGTTTMADWLSHHPSVYMSPVKEPHYFSSDLPRRVRTLRAYERLFANAREEHLAVGEASTQYLYSEAAVPAILEYADNPRFIVMLRNPVMMAYSLHDQALYGGHEHISDFEVAWSLQPERARGRSVRRYGDSRQLLYGERCLLGHQMQRLFDTVPRESVLALVLDDVISDPRREYLKVLSFLGLADDGRTEWPVSNSAKEHRSALVGRALQTVNLYMRYFEIPRLGTGLMNRLYRVNTRERQRRALSTGMREELKQFFRGDVELLGSLLERDLTHWVS